MEWLALVVWIILAAVGIPLAALVGVAFPTLGLQAVAVGAGFALCVLFIALADGSALLWCGVGVAMVGIVAVAIGSARLTSGDRSVSVVGQSAEEHAALLAGIQGPLFGLVAGVSVLAALGMTAA
jgi:hypothetical protein